MTSLLSIYYQHVLYEIRYSGTLITGIRKFHVNGLMRDGLKFSTLPKEVQDKTIKAIKKSLASHAKTPPPTSNPGTGTEVKPSP